MPKWIVQLDRKRDASRAFLKDEDAACENAIEFVAYELNVNNLAGRESSNIRFNIDDRIGAAIADCALGDELDGICLRNPVEEICE